MAENSDDTRKRKRWLLVSEREAAQSENGKDFDPDKMKRLTDAVLSTHKGKKPTFMKPQARASTKTPDTQEEQKSDSNKKSFWRRR